MNAWKLPWDGGCRCGTLRFRVTAPPLMTAACHCTGCQRMSASAFSLTVTVPSGGFAVTAGEPVIGGLHGPDVHHHHCDHCKSWVYTTVEGMDFFVNVRATMLDDHRWFAPFVEYWTAEGFGWANLGAPHRFAQAPADMAAYQQIIADYAERGARP